MRNLLFLICLTVLALPTLAAARDTWAPDYRGRGDTWMRDDSRERRERAEREQAERAAERERAETQRRLEELERRERWRDNGLLQ